MCYIVFRCIFPQKVCFGVEVWGFFYRKPLVSKTLGLAGFLGHFGNLSGFFGNCYVAHKWFEDKVSWTLFSLRPLAKPLVSKTLGLAGFLGHFGNLSGFSGIVTWRTSGLRIRSLGLFFLWDRLQNHLCPRRLVWRDFLDISGICRDFRELLRGAQVVWG